MRPAMAMTPVPMLLAPMPMMLAPMAIRMARTRTTVRPVVPMPDVLDVIGRGARVLRSAGEQRGRRGKRERGTQSNGGN